MFQGEFREREKGQAPDVIDRGDHDEDFWLINMMRIFYDIWLRSPWWWYLVFIKERFVVKWRPAAGHATKKTSNYNCSFFKFKSGINTRIMGWYNRATMPAETNFYPQKPSSHFFLRPSNSVTLLKQNSHKLSPENQLRSKATFMSCDEVAVKTEIKGNPCALLVVHKTLLW